MREPFARGGAIPAASVLWADPVRAAELAGMLQEGIELTASSCGCDYAYRPRETCRWCTWRQRARAALRATGVG